jgi:phytoene/squalene synthetase
MRAVGFGFVGLALGCIGGFWLGLMAGLIYTEMASVSCFEGYCGYVAAAIGALGAALSGLGGAIYGFRRGQRREEAAAF